MSEFILFNYKKKSIDKIVKSSQALLRVYSSRRSIREFSKEDVPLETIINIVKTAATAPSGANRQPWLFYIVKDHHIKTAIRNESESIEKVNYELKYSSEMKKEFENFKTNHIKPFLEDAPYLLIVFHEKYKITENGTEKNYYSLESASIALGFIVSCIHLCGLATVIYTPNPMRFLNKILGIGQNYSPFAILPIGYPAEKTKVPDITKKEFDDICKII